MSQTVEQAEAALAAAKAAYQNELGRNVKRSEGSGAQERRREENMKLLHDDVVACEMRLEEAKRNQHLSVSSYEDDAIEEWQDAMDRERS